MDARETELLLILFLPTPTESDSSTWQPLHMTFVIWPTTCNKKVLCAVLWLNPSQQVGPHSHLFTPSW